MMTSCHQNTKNQLINITFHHIMLLVTDKKVTIMQKNVANTLYIDNFEVTVMLVT